MITLKEASSVETVTVFFPASRSTGSPRTLSPAVLALSPRCRDSNGSRGVSSCGRQGAGWPGRAGPRQAGNRGLGAHNRRAGPGPVRPDRGCASAFTATGSSHSGVRATRASAVSPIPSPARLLPLPAPSCFSPDP